MRNFLQYLIEFKHDSERERCSDIRRKKTQDKAILSALVLKCYSIKLLEK